MRTQRHRHYTTSIISFLKSKHGSYLLTMTPSSFKALPKLGCNLNALVEPEDGLTSNSFGLEPLRDVQPHRLLQGGLYEGATEIDLASIPVKNEQRDREEWNCAPSHNRSEGLEDSLFQIASCHHSSFMQLGILMWSTLAM